MSNSDLKTISGGTQRQNGVMHTYDISDAMKQGNESVCVRTRQEISVTLL